MAPEVALFVKFLVLIVCHPMVHSTDFHFEVHGPGGSIQSPNYPGKYPKNVTSLWTLTAGSQYSMELNFTAFDVEKVKDCRYDFVQVRNSLNESWTSRPKYCNSKVPGLLNAENGWVQVRFISDSDREFTGFKLIWSAYQRVQTPTSSIMQPQASTQSTLSCPEAIKTMFASHTQTLTVSSCMKDSKGTVSNSQYFSSSKYPVSCSCDCKTCILSSTAIHSESILVLSRSKWSSLKLHTRISITNMHTSKQSLDQSDIDNLCKESSKNVFARKSTISIKNKETGEAKNKPSTIAIVFIGLTAIFALVSLVLGILLCSRFRENRIRVLSSTMKKQNHGEKHERELAMECIRDNPRFETDRFSIADSVGNKTQLTAQTSIDSYVEEFSKSEPFRKNIGFA